MLGADDAQDAWSDTFLAALRAYPKLDDEANVAAWLTTIARHKCIDVVRRNNRHGAVVAPMDAVEVNNIAAARGSIDDHVTDVLDAQLIEAFAALSDRQRIAVVAHHIEGRPFREIAAMLHTTPAAARRSAADGMAKLRALYQGDEP